MERASDSQDAERSARLSFARELSDGSISQAQLAARPEIVEVFRSRPVPPGPARILQRLASKTGQLDFGTGFLSRVRRARASVLGSDAAAPPRFLIRVDEYPDSRALDDSPQRWREATRAFHETLYSAGVPYLMALIPQYTHRPLDPASTGGEPLDDSDHAFIQQMADQGVTFAQHGTTHRTRYASTWRRSELCGLDVHQTEALIAEGRRRLADVGVQPRVFVPPFNRFDAAQFDTLGRHFDVIGGGPESIRLMGLHGGPLWRGEAVFLPCYPPLYAQAGQLPPVIDRLVARGTGTWVPIVLHVSWELGDRLRGLATFAQTVAPHAVSWNCFSEAIEMTRSLSAAQPTTSSLSPASDSS